MDNQDVKVKEKKKEKSRCQGDFNCLQHTAIRQLPCTKGKEGERHYQQIASDEH